jgi:antitoxin FitA
MTVNLSIKGVPATVAEQLRRRAERNHRSLQGELMAIIEEAARAAGPAPEASEAPAATSSFAAAAPRAPRSWQQGWKTIEQLMAERRASGWTPDPAMAGLPLAVDIVRADRDRR